MVNAGKIANTIVIRGAGEMATGIAVRLFNSGFKVIMTDTSKPSSIRRKVSFSEAIYDGEAEVEGVKAILSDSPQHAIVLLKDRVIPVLADPDLNCLRFIKPFALVDATLAKRNLGINKNMAPVVIGVGPGFCAGVDCHAVIESMRGHDLGRVIYNGRAQENTGIPGDIMGFTKQRVVYAPKAGVIELINNIGDLVESDQTIAKIGSCPVKAPISGVLRGMIRNKYEVSKGMKIGDVDPRGVIEYCYTISDKARTIAGGVLEVLMHFKYFPPEV